MKKLSILFIAIITSLQINAQSKVGTIDVDYILSKMPQLEQVNKDVKAYGVELDNQLQVKVDKYQALIEVYKKNETSYNEVDKKNRQDEVIALEQEIKKFQENGTSLVQLRQNELIQPLYKLIGDALNTVASEEKFTQVFTIDNSIAYLDPGLDVTLTVMKKMGLPVPTEE